MAIIYGYYLWVLYVCYEGNIGLRLRVLHGFYLYGYCMGWVLYGYYMGIIWVGYHIYYKRIIRVLYEYYMGIIWVLYRYYIGITRI